VMEAASKHLSSVTLELGGKSPVIVDESAQISTAARRIAWGKFLNNGQTCIAPDYIFVHDSIKKQFEKELVTTIQDFYGKDEDARKKSKDLCRIINQKNYLRIKTLLDASIEKGAQALIGGNSDAEQNYIAPTILNNVTTDMPIMSEEIFGPVLPILSYQNINQALEYINSHPKPLALYVFGRNDQNIDTILKNTSAGGTTINDTLIHLANPYLPFGGVNTSGIGSYHGEYGFKSFSHERAVLGQSSFSPLRLLYPPYGKTAQRFVDFLIKFF